MDNDVKDFDSQKLLQDFFYKYSYFTEEEKKEITAAWENLLHITKNIDRSSGEPYFVHCIGVATILAESRLDKNSIIAGFYHNVLALNSIDVKKLELFLGKTVFSIISGTAKITHLKINNHTLQQADSIRKMLFAMVDDIRVILVKLADRLDRLRNMKNISSETQKNLATEVIDIWAPLANRLGMASVKVEMEDLSLKYLNPEIFQYLKKMVALKKKERENYLEKAQKEIYKSALRAKIEVSVSSRAKHFYSIYQKMKKRNKAAEELFDLLAMRIICKNTADCYVMIGQVHSLWKPLEGRFKDYIAMPKANGYQSLHTTVLYEGKPLEIQIRTEEMHSVAEHGVASHWLYKKGTNKDSVSIENLSIINQLRELRKHNVSDDLLFSEIKDELLGDSIFVFTPNGDVKELPIGATAIDFAYTIHSHVGEKIVGAKADGHIIPLNYPLKNTQIIEILTNPQAHPTLNQLQIAKTTRARSKIRSWLQSHDQNFSQEKLPEKSEKTAETLLLPHRAHKSGTLKDVEDKSVITGPLKIRIGDTTNFLISLAGCCNPSYEDAIVGYVSRGRGIIIHKQDCSNFLKIPNIEERFIPVVWEDVHTEKKITKKTKKS